MTWKRENNKKIVSGQVDNYTNDGLIDYVPFKKNIKLIATDLNKQQVLEVDTIAIQQITFTGSLDCAGNTTTIFIYEVAKETILDFLQETVRVLWTNSQIYFWFDIILA